MSIQKSGFYLCQGKTGNATLWRAESQTAHKQDFETHFESSYSKVDFLGNLELGHSLLSWQKVGRSSFTSVIHEQLLEHLGVSGIVQGEIAYSYSGQLRHYFPLHLGAIPTDIVNISQFTTYAIDKVEDGTEKIWRGQGNYFWALSSQLHRRTARINKGTRTYRDYEKEMFERFRRLARSEPLTDGLNALDWLALGRHHGLPTRFLDWTDNPLVALYFAVEDEDETTDGAVFFRVASEEDFDVLLEPDNFESIQWSDTWTTYRPPYFHPRLMAQQSAFTIEPDPENQLFPYEDEKAQKTTKYKVPRLSKKALKKELREYGINSRMIYPGLDGVCKFLAETKFL